MLVNETYYSYLHMKSGAVWLKTTRIRFGETDLSRGSIIRLDALDAKILLVYKFQIDR